MFVEPKSPAEKAGLQEGDVIVGFNNQSLARTDDLQNLLTPDRIDVRSQLTILRRNQKLLLYSIPELSPNKD